MEGGMPPPPGQPPPVGQWHAPEAPAAPPPPPAGWQQQQQPQQPAAYGGLELAGWGSRAGAWALDLLVQIALLIVVFVPGGVVAAATNSGAAGVVLLILGGIAALAIWVLYRPFFMQRKAARNGQTLGKQWVGIRVVRVSGEPMGWGWSLLREVVLKEIALWVASSIAGGLTFFLLGVGGIAPYLADYLWPLWDDQNRAVHDMLAETRVVRAP
jgi:uncharacterized RDD family membrane protein YckC